METKKCISEDITPTKLYSYYETERLGLLRTKTMKYGRYYGELCLKLNSLCESGISIKDFEHQTSPINIETICIYGSVLYKSFLSKRKIKERKWIFFGPYIEREIRINRDLPNDFDFMVITKEGLVDDKVITPVRTFFKHTKARQGVTIRPETEEGFYGSYEVSEESAAVIYVCSVPYRGLKIHITYRSLDQFLNGIGNGDGLSESVVRYGIPLVGAERFHEIIKDIKTPQRNATHKVEWYEEKGRLEGKIVENGRKS